MALILSFKRGPTKQLPKEGELVPEYVETIQDAAYEYFHKVLPQSEAQAIWQAGQKIPDLRERSALYEQTILRIEQDLKQATYKDINPYFNEYKYKPVGIREFICSPNYLNKENEIYEEVLNCAEELNSGAYVEAVLTGGIGSGKTTLALYTNAYQLYLLSCMRSPHLMYGLDPSSEIIFIFQSITKELAQGVDYDRFKSMIGMSPYFKTYYPVDKRVDSRLLFPNRVIVAPVSGSETGAIGQNVIGGLIDELNYMAVVEKSKSSVDKGAFDQAVAVYNSISRRRKSRFMTQGKLPGILCLVSSKKYPGQFTDIKMEEARTDPTIYVYDKRVWDIKPKDFGFNGWINVFIGDETRKPRIMKADDQSTLSADDRHNLIIQVPAEYKGEFEKDITNALREIAGVSTLARHPFFIEVDKVNACFKKIHRSIFNNASVDFVEQRLTIVKKAFWKPELPRFMHVDLAISGDSAGIAVGTVPGFKDLTEDPEHPAFMPNFWFDAVLQIRPPKSSEILFGKIREVIRVLKKMGLNIHWVTFDTFQSTDSQQILRQWGFVTGPQSVDTVPCHAYDFAKTAFYEGRVDMPENPIVRREILMLEKNTKTGKVDHPPAGSKDCADAVAAVIYGLTMRREIWAMHEIPIMSIPESIYAATDKLKSSEQSPAYQETITDDETYMEQRRANRY